MVFIPIRGQITNLLVTFSTVVAELGALSVALTVNRMFETRVLGKRKSVFLSRHCLRMKLIAVLIMLSFVLLEVFFSVTSSTAFRDIKSQEPCVSLTALGEEGQDVVDRESEVQVTSFKCLRVNGKSFSQHVGNYSLVSNDVSCSEDALYAYNNSFLVLRSPSMAEKRCREFPVVTLELRNEQLPNAANSNTSFCVYYEYEGNKLYLSDSAHSGTPKDQIEFSVTTLYFDASSMITDIADNLLEQLLFRQSVEELHVRRKLFTSNRETVCDFNIGQSEGTEVPAYVIAVLVSLWVVLLATYVISFVASRRLLLTDLSDPFLWAHNTGQLETELKKTVRIDVSEENGRVAVSNSSLSMPR